MSCPDRFLRAERGLERTSSPPPTPRTASRSSWQLEQNLFKKIIKETQSCFSSIHGLPDSAQFTDFQILPRLPDSPLQIAHYSASPRVINLDAKCTRARNSNTDLVATSDVTIATCTPRSDRRWGQSLETSFILTLACLLKANRPV